jgi:ABC-type branched-subunit amino acid transport system ATPase component
MMDVNSRDFISGSGVVGSIIKIDPSVNSEQATLTIQDERDNTEKTVLIAKDTIIRQFQNAIELADLKVTDHVVVVGSPNSSGQIEAKLVRVVPETMEMMSPASGPAPFAQPL